MIDSYINIVEKAWGEERWIENSPKYCLKELIINKGYQCSIHYHRLKTETFYVISGRIKLFVPEFEESRESKIRLDTTKAVILLPNDFITLQPNTWHKFVGLENSVFMETSTQHFEEDSYRYQSNAAFFKSGLVDIKDRLNNIAELLDKGVERLSNL